MTERPSRARRRSPPRTGAGQRQTGAALEACYRLLLLLRPKAMWFAYRESL